VIDDTCRAGAAPDPAAVRDDLSVRLAAAREHRLKGDYTAAAAKLRGAVVQAEAVLGPDAAELSALLDELGIVDRFSGDFVEAEVAYWRALEIEDRPGPAPSVDTAGILHNLTGLAQARGDAESALPLALRGIDVRRSLPDAGPGGPAGDRATLAAILADAGAYDRARAELVELLEGGAPRYDTAVALHNLGSLRLREGKLAEAAVTLRRALTLKSVELGRRHPDLGVTLHNLGCCQQQLGRLRLARLYLQRAAAILDRAVAKDHPVLASCRRRLAPE
jgi:tetratricopeptide (TPR) repeat protein